MRDDAEGEIEGGEEVKGEGAGLEAKEVGAEGGLQGQRLHAAGGELGEPVINVADGVRVEIRAKVPDGAVVGSEGAIDVLRGHGAWTTWLSS